MYLFKNDFEGAIDVLNEWEEKLISLDLPAQQELNAIVNINQLKFLCYAHNQLEEESLRHIQLTKEARINAVNLRKNRLALGGSLENAVVLDEDKVLNKDGLRFSDEFVRHKLLDFIGDISLSGYRMFGSFFSSHPGHEINIQLLKRVFQSPDNWELVCSN